MCFEVDGCFFLFGEVVFGFGVLGDEYIDGVDFFGEMYCVDEYVYSSGDVFVVLRIVGLVIYVFVVLVSF